MQRAIADVFGVSPDEPLKADVRRAQDRQNFYVFWYYIKKNQAGGQALFLPDTHPWLMDFALKLVLPQRDVQFQEPMAPLRRGNEYEGALTYIHKVKEGHDIYFVANSTAKDIDTKMILRGTHPTLVVWNPLTGGQEPAESTHLEENGQPATAVRLVVPAVSSRFYIAP